MWHKASLRVCCMVGPLLQSSSGTRTIIRGCVGSHWAAIRAVASEQAFHSSSNGVESGNRSNSTIDQDEVNKFSRLASHWWNEAGEFAPLHTMNDLRLPLIRDAVIAGGTKSLKSGTISKCLPLGGTKILDVGCGGGILSEPLARLGAEVTGLDASEENIKTAKWHAAHDSEISSRLSYVCMTVEELSSEEPGKYDGVVASEIIEHVANQPQFVKSCCQLVKPGGSIFFTTMSKTYLSYALAIVAAERIFRIVPQGVHDWNKFINSEDLKDMLLEEGFDVRLVHGMAINPLNRKWCWVSNTSVNYALHAVKTSVSEEPEQVDVKGGEK